MVITPYAYIAHPLPTNPPPHEVFISAHFIITFDPVRWAQQALSPSLPTFYRELEWFAQGRMARTSDSILQLEWTLMSTPLSIKTELPK